MALKLNRIFVLSFSLLTLSVLSGCTGPTHLTLSPEVKRKIESVDAYVFLQQEHLYAKIKESNISMATGGGLIPALIDAGVNSYKTNKAENNMAPVRDVLSGFDLASCFKEELISELAHVKWLDIKKIEIAFGFPERKLRGMLENEPEKAVLVLDIDCFFSSEFASVNVNSKSYIMEKPANGNVTFRNFLYKGKTDCMECLSTYCPTPAAAVEKWVVDNGTPLKTAIRKVANEVASRLATELNS